MVIFNLVTDCTILHFFFNRAVNFKYHASFFITNVILKYFRYVRILNKYIILFGNTFLSPVTVTTVYSANIIIFI